MPPEVSTQCIIVQRVDGFLQIDCTKEVDLCRDHHITGFPSLRVFRKGHDEVMNHGLKEHESYKGKHTWLINTYYPGNHGSIDSMYSQLCSDAVCHPSSLSFGLHTV